MSVLRDAFRLMITRGPPRHFDLPQGPADLREPGRSRSRSPLMSWVAYDRLLRNCTHHKYCHRCTRPNWHSFSGLAKTCRLKSWVKESVRGGASGRALPVETCCALVRDTRRARVHLERRGSGRSPI